MNDKSPISASAPYCLASTICAIFVSCLLCCIGFFLAWENWLYFLFIIPVYVILYYVIEIVFMLRLGAMRQRKQYKKMLSSVERLSKWIPIGKQNSYLHSVAAFAYFMTEDDEAMLQELALIVDRRWALTRHFYQALYFVIHGDESAARECITQFLALPAKGEDALRTKQQLELLLKIIDPAEQARRNENIQACLAITNNDRIKKFLLEQESKG